MLRQRKMKNKNEFLPINRNKPMKLNRVIYFVRQNKTCNISHNEEGLFFLLRLVFQHNKYPAPTQFLCETTKVKTHYFGTDRDSVLNKKETSSSSSSTRIPRKKITKKIAKDDYNSSEITQMLEKNIVKE